MGKHQVRYLVSAFFVIGCFVAFQNCAGSKFDTQNAPIVDAACTAAAGCVSAASSGTPSPNSMGDQNSSGANNNSSTGSASGSGAASSSVVDPRTLYNFISDDEGTCESSIMSRLGKSVACSMGGGCGISCGFPGSSCPSANPSLWGACMTVDGKGPGGVTLPAAPAHVDPTLLYNFGAPTKAQCEDLIQSRGKVGTCSMGGGCGISCGMPSASCPSANPSLWGACLQ